MTDKPKRPRDANQLAKFIVDMATEDEEPVYDPDTSGQRKGGLKGGASRDKALSEGRKRQIAVKAATARWEKAKLKEE
ncbi:histone H1 [Pseudosulfitobacter pseudonitzschiae]|uniref:histone H1 n=1 Tax=Pseudosulfitobacter pseudonitzschiae TaxID=1402135 RepID=UPI001AFC2FC8|nr:histone H1 [Pseudosulfitobacter pseudonitzschiae]MBM1815964.1 histone H1 [Pseudosulfitobacter pseudonitzschiae]MBM1833270.1 histone H1 [Pseudosulfitobacter pseudonitzschiae]MBM1838138.1 histone H1 [Pseudosulfitobacter pseudonitzschiae]MBM1842669.1 histone H1 [Pseudosulfitobacter pseudonitzschiae]MBM1847536.1 histone H1 [Pseudosulfitobacter pseudonitzschiae]